ncbi:MAG: nitroreductase family deazaflavin-dependent oxidoreductase [Solirubrobacteraceae bacterium]
MPTPPPYPPQGFRRKFVNAFSNANVTVYRLTRGRVGGKVGGAPVLLLDHVGRKTGRRRTTPLIYMEDGADLVIVAARAGADTTPTWWLNLKANPATTVLIGSQHRKVVARQATGEEKQRLWPRLVESYGDYAVYQKRTERDIPVIILGPAQ